MMLGFIGAGTVARTIARHVLAVGHQVMLSNSRGPDTLSALVGELGAGASAGTPQQAADQDLVFLAVSWPNVQSALFSVADWSGGVLVDATNRFASYDPLTVGDISGRTSSEIVADLAPGAKVVKAFSSVPMTWISDFSLSRPRTAIFVSGDYAEAKRKVCGLIDEIGFCSIDLGSLDVGGRIQQLGGPLSSIKLIAHERFVI